MRQLIDLNRIYETYIRLPYVTNQTLRTGYNKINYACSQEYLEFLQFRIYPLINELKRKKIIKWYHFLWHPLPDKTGEAIHIRMEIPKGGIRELKKHLPEDCLFTKKISKKTMLNGIEGVNKNLLAHGNLEYAWWLIGECSEWVMSLICIHRYLTIKEVRQFIHYFDNQLYMEPYQRENRIIRKLRKMF